MEERHDGTYGNILSLPEKFKELLGMTPEELGLVKYIHVGTEEELKEVKLKGHVDSVLEDRICALEKKVNLIMAQVGLGNKDEILVVEEIPKERR